MTWQNQLKGDPLAWLLEKDSPNIRWVNLRALRVLKQAVYRFQSLEKESPHSPSVSTGIQRIAKTMRSLIFAVM